MEETYGTLFNAHHPGERARHTAAHHARRSLTWALIVFCCLGLLGSTVAVWAQLYPLNTERWVEATAPLSKNPAVTRALSDYATREMMEKLQIEQHLTKLLPMPSFLVSPLTNTVRTYTHAELANFFQSAAFQQAWDQINRQTHARALAMLRGENSRGRIAEQALTVNLLPVIFQGAQDFNQHLPAPFSSLIQLPTLPASATPDQQRQALSQALNKPLPPTFGQVVLYQGPQLALVSRTIKLLDVLAIALPLTTLVLLILALLVSVNRRRTVIQLGLGAAMAMLLFAVLLPYVARPVAAALQNGIARDLVGEGIAGELRSLQVVCLWLLAAGLLAALIAFLCGHRARLSARFARANS